MPEDDIECEYFTVISIDSLLVYYLQVYLGNCASKVAKKQMTDYLDENVFKDKELVLLKATTAKECIICNYWFFNDGFKF